ncbi:MAG: hypothetical protein GXO54_06890 [Chloroflexi bacterium]|nr:hypothetical protein [Chloroflexota bacterium]
MIFWLIRLINFATSAFELFLVVYVVTTLIFAPWHPVRRALARFFEPILAPIRRHVPTVGIFDFSPLVLILLVEVVRNVLIQVLLVFV